MPPPTICQRCNSGYIKYSGLGIEKIESEISRIFAGARVKLLDNHKDLNIESADIFISTSSIIKKDRVSFSLVSVLGIDNSLNRIDFRAAEKTFLNLVGLFTLTDKKMIIQTYLPQHSCFQALKERDLSVFYRDELKQRRQLKFPPYAHIILVKLRGRNEERIKEFSNTLFNKLNTCNKNKDIKIVALNPAQPFKLRDNFCWQILIKGNSPKKINNFLKINLKDFSHSGIIVTVDVDPI
jgi:primosomal protein N' (replication factor Y)